jgi:hypothetical protein
MQVLPSLMPFLKTTLPQGTTTASCIEAYHFIGEHTYYQVKSDTSL